MDNEAILEKLRSGGRKELEMIYTAFRKEFIFWVMKNYSCPLDDAQDIYQFSVLTFYENVINGKLTHLKSTVKTYLFSIGKNKALELGKSSRRFREINESERLDAPAMDADMLEEEEKELQKVAHTLEQLGDPCTSLLKYYYYERKSMEEIAIALDYKNADTAKNLKYKCLKRLRKLFQSEG